MKKAELDEYRARLLALRARLRGDVSHLADAALNNNRVNGGSESGMPIHMADQGSDAFEQEFTLSLMQTEENVLGRIETALERILDGSYGVCEECGVAIPKARLNALPFASSCVKCASKQESQG